MKKLMFVTAILITAFMLNTETKAQYRSADYGLFYSSLAPHGAWIELNDGLVVWQPRAISRGWAPYTRGQWIWTVDGWYWDSYEPYGYITYHYGRWYYDDYYGWLWVPDHEWAPAWVEWRYDNSYIGWAPLSPYALFSVNIGVHFSVSYNTPYHHWHFVKYRYFCDPYVYNYYTPSKNVNRFFSKTKYRTNYGYEHGRVVNRGVDVDVVRRQSGRAIEQRDIVRSNNSRDFERNSGSDRNSDRVRTFTVSRDELRTGTDKVDVKRAERNTSLQVNKVEIGERTRMADRNSAGNREEIRTSSRETEKVSTGSRNNEIRNRSNETNTAERPQVQRKDPRLEEARKVEVNRNERSSNESTRANRQEVRKEAPAQRQETNVQKRNEPQRRESKAPEYQAPQKRSEPREQRRSEPQRVERSRSGGSERESPDRNSGGRRR